MCASSLFDVIILGSGPAASVAALVLNAGGYRVAMAGLRTGKKIHSVGESLSPDIRAIFSSLGLDILHLENMHLPAFETYTFWDSSFPDIRDSVYNAEGNGWYLDKAAFNQMLSGAAEKRGVFALQFDALEADPCHGGGWQLTGSNGNSVSVNQGRFLIDCTGRDRYLQKKLNIAVEKYDTLIAVNTVFDVTGGTLSQAAKIESVKDGWWYTAAIPGGKRIATFYTDAKTEIFKSVVKSNTFFKRMADTHLLGSYVGSPYIANVSALSVRYANSEMAEVLYGQDWVCAGDSAAAFDPLSSQGISTAMKMSFKAAKAVQEYLRSGCDTAFVMYTFEYHLLFQQYLQQRAMYYGRVDKWPESPFWRINSQKHNLNQYKYETEN